MVVYISHQALNEGGGQIGASCCLLHMGSYIVHFRVSVFSWYVAHFCMDSKDTYIAEHARSGHNHFLAKPLGVKVAMETT